jgi:antitoxin (DNA-binding transcriptional repressor) of toxin-antitoxin stability system
MIMVNIHEMKARLSEFIEAAVRGEQVVICKRNEPLVELKVVRRKRTEPRPLGLAKGLITVPESFFEPMPDDWIASMENGQTFPAADRKDRS